MIPPPVGLEPEDLDLVLRAEEEIVARIQAGYLDMFVDKFPDDPTSHTGVNPRGEILVGYRGTDFGKPRFSLFAVLQERELRFELAILVRDLRHHSDAYPILAGLRALLTGFRPASVEALYCERDAFVRENEGVWQYSAFYRGAAPALEFSLPGGHVPPGEEPLVTP